MRRLLAAFALVATPGLALAASPSRAVDDLRRYAPRALADWGVPGAALVVVKDGRAVLVEGHGTLEAGSAAKVGPHTLFALASLTKGFTAAAAGTLVDDHRLAWDEPLASVLPGFHVQDPYVTKALTVRDALAHRSGLAESSDTSQYFGAGRSDILRRLGAAPQGSSFRSGFTYLNVLYVAIGEALAARSGRSYEDLVATRILEPLGMRDARFGWRAVQTVADRARPHDDHDGKPHPVDMENMDDAAPAAGLYASASDVARWLLAQLGDGTLDGTKAWSPDVARAMRSPQAIVPFEHIPKALFPSTHFLAYGFGWMLQDYRGEFVTWNTGGVRGMTCSIAFLPDRRFGVAVLTNGPRTSLPEALVWRAIDAELGAPPRDWSALRLERSMALRAAARKAEEARYAPPPGAKPPSLTNAECAGSYEQAAAGVITVTDATGALALQLGNGPRGVLRPFDGDGFLLTWERSDFGRSLVRFTRGEDGRVTGLELEDLGRFERLGP